MCISVMWFVTMHRFHYRECLYPHRTQKNRRVAQQIKHF